MLDGAGRYFGYYRKYVTQKTINILAFNFMIDYLDIYHRDNGSRCIKFVFEHKFEKHMS